ncbi:MAG: DNA primase [Desulfurococcales archaeon ex4484_217_1]|nr:MAG: DNA primase [Desulfurococcales archaeon ex4484_217_1]
MKYLIKAKIEVEGIVEKPDVIGAIFGQTEGLLGEDYDLRELQDRGRIGRIQVELKTIGSRSIGEIVIPSNLDRVETALLAALLEVVDRVGPYPAKVRIEEILDLRMEKIRKVVERAKEILQKMIQERRIDVKEIVNNVIRDVRSAEIIKYGPEGLPAGPDVDKADTIILVEGRADVINMLKHGYRNVIAIEGAGTKIPETIIKLSKEKTTIAFLDGDRGGDLILKELIKFVDLDYIVRAPSGKEVEELTGKEIVKALKNAVPVEQYLSSEKEKRLAKEISREERTVTKKVEERRREELIIPHNVLEDIKSLQGTLKARIYDREWKLIEEFPVRELVENLSKSAKEIYAIIFDGVVTQRLVDIAASKNVRYVIGARIGGIMKRPLAVKIYSFNEVFK